MLLLRSVSSFLAAATTQLPPVERPWMDTKLSPDERTALLLQAMSLDEKVAQLGYGGCGDINDTIAKHPHGVGGCGVVGPPK